MTDWIIKLENLDVLYSYGVNISLQVWSFGLADMIWSSISILPCMSGATSVLNREYTSRSRIFISIRARLLHVSIIKWGSQLGDIAYFFPVHPRAPVENAKNSLFLSLAPSGSSHRSGQNVSGHGNACSLSLWTEYGWQLTIVPSGMW